jgi:hypothetical protein
MMSWVQLCSKAPFSTNQDMLNKFFVDSLAKFSRTFQPFPVLDDDAVFNETEQNLMKLHDI